MIRFGPEQAFAVDTHGSIDSSPALAGTGALLGDPEVGSYVDEPHEARATQALSDAGTMRAVPPFGEIRL
jgi:hypothetical protein